jgi:hypothetical protein
MNDKIVSAVFDSRSEAETAARDLRDAGVPDSALSVIAGHDQVGGDYGDAQTHEVKEGGEGALKGALGGAGLGAILGIAALAIPGVGPLVAAGAIATSAIPGAAAIGAGAGAVVGGLGGLLTSHGVSDDDAKYYEERINNGGVFLSVDTREAAIDAEKIQDILHRSGGHNFSREKSTGQTNGAFGFEGDRSEPMQSDRSLESEPESSGRF